MAVEKLSVILELVSGQYKKEAREAATATGQIGNSAKTVTGSLSAMIGPAAIGGAILGLGKMALAAGENADRLFDLQAQTGVSTDKLQEYEFVANAAGASTEFFSDSVKQIVKSMDTAIAGTGAASDAYTKLGISITGANGEIRAAGDITEEVIDRLAGMENITERNALAQDIFGKKWEETVSVLDMGSEAIAGLRAEGQKGVVSAQSLANADKFRETWQKFTATIGPKLNELLGSIAPALTEVAEGAMDALDAMEPLIDALGAVAGAFGDANAAIEEGRDSPSEWAQTWAIASDIGKGAIFGMVGVLGALFDEENALKDNTRDVTQEIHDSWTGVGTAAIALRDSLGPTITMLDNQNRSHRNVAAAADTQRSALIKLADYQRSQLDPISQIIGLQQELITAQEALATAQADGKTPADELALAQLAVVDAMLALQGAGLALTPDQIQAFAQTLITQFGYSEQAALDTLEALNLLDGWKGTATFTVQMNTNAAGTSGIKGTGNINSLFDQFGFDSGGIVPGPRGSRQLILAHGGETILPTHKAGSYTKNGPTITVMSPMNNFRQDLQYATILASVTNLVEGF